jgi:hypothetical protein
VRLVTLLMLLTTTTLDYLTTGDKLGRGQILPSRLAYLIELFGLIALLYVLFYGVRGRFQHVRPAYWFVFGALGLCVLFGILSNSQEPGTIFAGMRNTLRAIPWFFVPAVYAFSDRDVRAQIAMLLAVCLVQVPLTIGQRLGSVAPDTTTGTMQISSILSIFLICAICVATAFYVRRRIRLGQFLALFVLLLLPTTINQTKGTLLLLPLGVLAAYLSASRSGQRLRTGLLALALLFGFGLAFVPAYDYFQQNQETPRPIGEFFTKEGRLRDYLWKDEGLGTRDAAGRADSIAVPIEFLSRDPVTLAFGLGIGNASASALGEGFEGRYARLFDPFLSTAFARIVLELGVLGISLLLVLMWLILSDARVVSRRHRELLSDLSAGWVGVVIVMTISIFYKDITAHAALSFAFWYLSGLIAAHRMRSRAPTRSGGHAYV